ACVWVRDGFGAGKLPTVGMVRGDYRRWIMAEQGEGGSRSRRRRRYLTPVEKYQVWCEVVSGQGSQREVADRWGVDRSTVIGVVKTAKQSALDGLAASRPGRPGKTGVELALEDARAEIARLRETITAQAVELHLFWGKGPWG
ncbi:MAG: hypothetical protein ABIJ48_12455, partial [Actinomycetota bacterium]